jgi:hypothetical protein
VIVRPSAAVAASKLSRRKLRFRSGVDGRRDVEIVLLPPQLHVPAAHGDVVEEDVAAGTSAHRGHRLIQQKREPALGPRSRTISAEPAGSPVGSGSKSGRFDPRVLSAGPSSTRCSFALVRNPDLTSGAWPETREVSNWARF